MCAAKSIDRPRWPRLQKYIRHTQVRANARDKFQRSVASVEFVPSAATEAATEAEAEAEAT